MPTERTRLGMTYSTKARNNDGLSEGARRYVLIRDTFATGKYRKRPMKELAIDEQIDIVHAFLVEQQTGIDVARRYRVSKTLVY